MSLRSHVRGAMPRYLFAVLLLLAAFVLVMAPGGSSAASNNARAASLTWQGAASLIADPFSPLDPPIFGPNVRANRDTTAFGQHEPSLAVSRVNTNTVFAAAKDYREGNIKRVWIYGSTDGGATWPVQLRMPNLPSTQSESDPVVMARDDGRIYVSCLTTGNEGIWITWTDDAGQTWQPSVPLVQNQSSLQDKEWIAIDNNPSSPYYHRMYVMYAPAAAYVVEQHSTDGGLTWSAQQQIGASGTEYTYPVVAGDGTVYNFMMLNWGPNRTGTVQMTKSTNGGVTWSTPAAVTTAQQPASPIRSQDQFRFFAILSAAVDPNSVGPNHVLYVAWTDNRNFSTNGTDVVYVKSTNGGVSWGPVTRLSHDPTGVVRDHITPMMVVGADSKVHAFWLDRRRDPNNRLFDSWYSSSTNGGATWDPDTRVSTTSQDLNVGFPPGSGNAAGDYWGLDTWRDTVYVAWNDTRSGDQDILVSKGLMNSAITATPTSTPQPTATATSTTSSGTATPTCEPGFHVVTSPNVAGSHNVLNDIAVVSANDIWAVGHSRTNVNSPNYSTLIMRWNGSQWNIVPSPNVAQMSNNLYAVSAISANDIWAVGATGAPGQPPASQTLTMHWDGSQWSIVNSPSPSAGRDVLYGVAGASANDVWAVGATGNPGSGQTLTMRWNGSAWSVVPSPNPSTYDNVLNAVAVVSPNDVWAVGYLEVADNSFEHTLTMRWDGSQWSHVPSPNPSVYSYTRLNDVAVVSASDVWAVGQGQVGAQVIPFVIRWNGSQWNTVTTPSPPDTRAVNLYGVTVVSASDIWVVGSYFALSQGYERTLAMRWNGSNWDIPNSPSPGALANLFHKAAALPGGDVMAVGAYSTSAGALYRTLVARYVVACSTATPTVSHSSTHTSTATATRTATRTATAIPTQTATSTPTVCPAGFQDVPTGHPDYNNIRCAVCNGAMDFVPCGGVGEPCVPPNNYPYFRPAGAYTWTRVEIAKVLSLAAGFNEPAVGHSYEDVPPGHPYYAYIQRMTSRNIMGGFPCGQPGEPCGPENRPYFRPGISMARVIFAKVLANTVLPDGQYAGQTFQDVLRDNPYYVFIERLAYAGIIEGYPCGGPGEPCDPGNRPYFRPNHTFSDSRAEMARMVKRAFFPSCSFCTLSFTDVPANHTFHASIQCLACRGIVSGYADGTFKPDNLVTRSQLAKIVSNAGNFQEDPGPQIFEDVPQSNPFYQWINRLTIRGYMSGYTCGSPGEPCRNGNRPYFRPFADATRAQTSKIVSNAARYNDPPAGQAFEDVPPTHPFYEWIQRLASRSIMGGYQCGGPGEPCGSGNRAYFRPYNNVTRGQSAKIVTNTFFPECGAP